MYNVTLKRVPATSVAAKKSVHVTYSGGVFLALGIQHTMLIRYIVIVACPAVQYLSTLSHKRYDFCKNVIKQKMYVLIF